MTLVELLVAAGITTMVFVMLLQILNGTIQATGTSNQKMESGHQAQNVFDVLGSDLERLVQLRDIGLLAKNDGNSEIAFLVEGRGDASDTRLMSVAYRLTDGKLHQYLEAVSWNEADPISKIATQTNGTVVGSGILRFEVVLVLSDGRIVPLNDSGEWISDTVHGTPLPDYFRMMNPNRNATVQVVGLIIGTVSVSEKQYRLLESIEQLDSTVALFPPLPTPSADPKSPFAVWESALYSPDLDQIPSSVLSTLNIKQRSFLLK